MNKLQTDKPKVSVVTIVYNGLDKIENTIISVINQTYKNIEYIVIDGNSDDGTLNIIEKYQNKIEYWVSEPDHGIYDAMNKGIFRAKGDWICFINSGDSFYSEESLEKVFDQPISFNTAVIYADVYVLSFKSKFIKKAEDLNIFEIRLPFSHQSSLVRTSYLKNRPFNLEYKICADYDFFYPLYLSNRSLFQYVPVVMASFDATDGLSTNYPMRAYKELAICRKENSDIFWKFKYIFKYMVFYLKKIIKVVLKLN